MTLLAKAIAATPYEYVWGFALRLENEQRVPAIDLLVALLSLMNCGYQVDVYTPAYTAIYKIFVTQE